MKFRFVYIILFLTFKALNAQTYEKDWAQLMKKLDAKKTLSTPELEAFETKYKKQFDKYPDNSTQFYSLLASNYYQEKNYPKVEENYGLSYQYSKTATDTLLIYIAELNLAYYYQGQNYLEASEKFYNACMYGMSLIYGANSREYTEVFNNYTSLLVDLEKYEQAKPNVEALLYYYKTLDGENNKTYLRLLTLKAIILQNLGYYEDAIAIYKDIVDEKRILNLGDTTGYIISIQNLGDSYREFGKYDLAIFNLKKAKQLHQMYKVNERSILATIDNNLALCYKSYGDSKNAEICYNNSISVYKSLNLIDTEPFCSTLSNKADLLRSLGRYLEASELLLISLDIRKKRFGTESENYANALTNLGLVYYDVKQYDSALERFLEANEIYKKTVGESHQGYANNLNNLSGSYLEIKDYKNAESYKLQALKIIENTVGKNHYRYASFLISTFQLYLKINNISHAESNLREALILIERNFGKKHELYAQAQLLLAEIYATQNKFEQATPFYFESLDFYTNLLNDYFATMSEDNQSQYLYAFDAVFGSYNVFLINYKIKHPTKNLTEHINRSLRYQLLLKSLLANNASRLGKEVKASNDQDLKKIYSDWLLVKNELVNNYKSTQPAFDDYELRNKASELETKLKSKLKNFSNKNTLTFESIKQNLNENEAAIEIFKVNEAININDTIGKIIYAAHVIRKNSVQPDFIIFKNGKDLENKYFENYYKSIEDQKQDSVSYKYYFKPFEKSLSNVTKIYISAEGVFHKVNLLGLYNPIAKKYVIDNFEIYPTSTLSSIINRQTKTPQISNTASLFGYPDYDYDLNNKNQTQTINSQQVASRYGLVNLAKLPGTKVEVEEIDKELKAKNWSVTLFTDQFASESNLRKVKSPSILHIATHGYFLKDIQSDDKLILGFQSSNLKDNKLLRSGIILAGVGPATSDSLNVDSENDGIVTAAEASLLNLTNTELVVLSACQTGLGDEMGTEGVAGLQRSFSIAGAKNIIMSLWPVDDYATQLLMTEFYKNYAQTNSIENSFKKAQQVVKVKYPHPYYWSAFELLKTFN
ncbi:MAG: CHAT domain-containing tetratricopeptide repeat protein [Bacteroidota bacterium]|nr:CHAT domain-containing tetratricopeptide repeat protein [Bacteroidota bacterium]